MAPFASGGRRRGQIWHQIRGYRGTICGGSDATCHTRAVLSPRPTIPAVEAESNRSTESAKSREPSTAERRDIPVNYLVAPGGLPLTLTNNDLAQSLPFRALDHKLSPEAPLVA